MTNSIIEAALTILAVLFILMVAICVMAIAVVVFLDIVDKIKAGFKALKEYARKLFKK